MGWQAGRGYGEDLDKRLKEEESRRGGAGKGFRFWLPPNTERNIIFLDDNPPLFYEHAIHKDGHWRNYATCTGVDGEGRWTGEGCPLCEVGDKPYFAGVWTIIDLHEYKDKKGRVWKNQKRLLVAKQQVVARLTRRSDTLREGGRSKGLAGMKVRVYRSSAKANATGDDFDVIGPAKKSEVLDKDGKVPKVHDYDEIFTPNVKLISQFARYLGRGAGGAYSDRNEVFAGDEGKSTGSEGADDLFDDSDDDDLFA